MKQNSLKYTDGFIFDIALRDMEMEKVEIFELCQKEMGVDSTIFVTSWKEIQAYSHANIYTHTEKMNWTWSEFAFQFNRFK